MRSVVNSSRRQHIVFNDNFLLSETVFPETSKQIITFAVCLEQMLSKNVSDIGNTILDDVSQSVYNCRRLVIFYQMISEGNKKRDEVGCSNKVSYSTRGIMQFLLYENSFVMNFNHISIQTGVDNNAPHHQYSRLLS